jgi:nuclear transcription factor Y gamma
MESSGQFSLLNSFWQTQLQIIEESELDFKNYSLPLARIKKVMKTDDDVKNMVKFKFFDLLLKF